MSPWGRALHLRFGSMRPSAKNPPHGRGKGCCIPGCAGRAEIVVVAASGSTRMTCTGHAKEWMMSSACRLAKSRSNREAFEAFAKWANAQRGVLHPISIAVSRPTASSPSVAGGSSTPGAKARLRAITSA